MSKKNKMLYKLFYIFTSSYNGALATIFPMFFLQVGISDNNIGFIIMIPTISVLFLPFLGNIIDKYNITKNMAIFCICISVLFLMFFLVIESVWLLVLNYFLYQTVRAPILNCIDNIIISDCIRKNYDYGKIRVFASISWGASLFIFLPIVKNFGFEGFFIFGILFACMSSILVFNMDNIKSEKNSSEKFNLFSNQNFLNFFCFGILFGSVVAINPAYQSLLLIEMNSSEIIISFAMFLSTFLMIFTMPLSSELEKILSTKRLLDLVVIITLLKYVFFIFATRPSSVLIGATFNAVAMGLYIPIGIRILRSYVSTKNSNFLMMLNSSATAIASLIVSIIAGFILKYSSINNVFLFLFIIILFSLFMLKRVEKF